MLLVFPVFFSKCTRLWDFSSVISNLKAFYHHEIPVYSMLHQEIPSQGNYNVQETWSNLYIYSVTKLITDRWTKAVNSFNTLTIHLWKYGEHIGSFNCCSVHRLPVFAFFYKFAEIVKQNYNQGEIQQGRTQAGYDL